MVLEKRRLTRVDHPRGGIARGVHAYCPPRGRQVREISGSNRRKRL